MQTAKRVGELRGTLGGLQFASLTDYKQQEAAIVELAGLVGSGQERPVLGPLATNLKKIVGDELARVLKSATANAENNLNRSADELYIADAIANEGPTIKRWRPRAQGRAFPIHKPMTHITIVVADREA